MQDQDGTLSEAALRLATALLGLALAAWSAAPHGLAVKAPGPRPVAVLEW